MWPVTDCEQYSRCMPHWRTAQGENISPSPRIRTEVHPRSQLSPRNSLITGFTVVYPRLAAVSLSVLTSIFQVNMG